MPIQESRPFEVLSPLGPDKLLFRSMTVDESLSSLFHIELDMLSPDSKIKPGDLLGKNLAVRVRLRDGGSRFFNGAVTHFSHQGRHKSGDIYHATLRPWLWFLTRTADSKVFQQLTVPDIIQEVFADSSFADVDDRLSKSYRTWEYCVQYSETDFNFVSRLMEQEGIYYFFKHTKDKHELVLCDAPSAHETVSGYEKLKYVVTEEDLWPAADTILDWRSGQGVRSGAYVLSDYDFEKPRVSLEVNKLDAKPHEKGDYEVYEYPGEYVERGDGENYVQTRLEESQSDFEYAVATSTARGITCGCLMELTDYYRGDQNREYLVTSARYEMQNSEYEAGAETDPFFHSSFTAIDSKTPFRPSRRTPKPLISGVQTARVVGPSGEEIYCDKYGRVKIQFHWDRVGEDDENSSLWVRVAHNVAGKKWGFLAIPRVGQEVVVDFLEGDPDRPLIVGSVYNAEQMPHYQLPTEMTKSYIKTNSSKGGEGFNELMFEDKKGEERVFIHAEKDMDTRVKNDSKSRIYGNRDQIIGWDKDGQKGGDQREMVHQDRHQKIKRNHVEHVEGNFQLMIGNGEADDGGNVDIVVEKKRTEKIGAGSDLLIDGARREKVNGVMSLDVGKDLHIKTGQGDLQLECGPSNEIHLKAGMKIIIEAGMQLSLLGPGGFVDIGPAGVTIQGTMVHINSGGSAGSGKPCQPEPPDEAQEAAPVEPSQAHDSKSGQKSAL